MEITVINSNIEWRKKRSQKRSGKGIKGASGLSDNEVSLFWDLQETLLTRDQHSVHIWLASRMFTMMVIWNNTRIIWWTTFRNITPCGPDIRQAKFFIGTNKYLPYIVVQITQYQSFFFLNLRKKNFGGHIHTSYFGVTGTPILDFWWHLLWVSKPGWVLPYSHCGGECNVQSLRSTSGATRCQSFDGWQLWVANLRPILHLMSRLFFYLIYQYIMWMSTFYTTPGFNLDLLFRHTITRNIIL